MSRQVEVAMVDHKLAEIDAFFPTQFGMPVLNDEEMCIGVVSKKYWSWPPNRVAERQDIPRIGNDDEVPLSGVEDNATTVTVPEKRDWPDLTLVCLVEAFSGLERCHVMLLLDRGGTLRTPGSWPVFFASLDLDPAFKSMGASVADWWTPAFESTLCSAPLPHSL